MNPSTEDAHHKAGKRGRTVARMLETWQIPFLDAAIPEEFRTKPSVRWSDSFIHTLAKVARKAAGELALVHAIIRELFWARIYNEGVGVDFGAEIQPADLREVERRLDEHCCALADRAVAETEGVFGTEEMAEAMALPADPRDPEESMDMGEMEMNLPVFR